MRLDEGIIDLRGTGIVDDFDQLLLKVTRRKAFITSLIIGLILVVAWAGLLAIVRDGWGITATNIGLLLVTLLVVGIPSIQFLKLYMPAFVAGFLTGLILFVMIVLIRSVFLEAFGVT